MKHINNNIDNLLNLWTTVSKPFNGFASDSIISYSQIQNSEWPNKIWTSKKLTINTLNNIKNLIKNSQIKLHLVDFELEGKSNRTFIENAGFELTSSLPGMHLPLTTTFVNNTKLHFLMVTNSKEAEIWCNIFKQSFGYFISKELVIKNMNKVHFYIAFENDIPIGVVKLHLSNDTAGIYSLGVPAHFRGKGYAKDIMYFLLNKALSKGATVATLQASKLAQGMHERIGFSKDFTMNSYTLKTP